MSADRIRVRFTDTDVVAVVGPAISRRTWARSYLVRRLLRTLFVAIILAVVIPMLLIGLLDLKQPELYPEEPSPYPYDYMRLR